MFGSIVSGPVVVVVVGSVFVAVVVVLELLVVVCDDSVSEVGVVLLDGSVVLGVAVVGVTLVGAAVVEGDVLELELVSVADVVAPSVVVLDVVSVVVGPEEPSWLALEQPATKQTMGKNFELTRMLGHLTSGEDMGSEGAVAAIAFVFEASQMNMNTYLEVKPSIALTPEFGSVEDWAGQLESSRRQTGPHQARKYTPDTRRHTPSETIRHMARGAKE